MQEENNQPKKEPNVSNNVQQQPVSSKISQRTNGPSAIGEGGDPLFRRIRASKEQLIELLNETVTIQDWIQRETSNKVALNCLENEDLKEIYFKIKDGFADYGPILLMGFKSPLGVEIPRLKILDTDGEIIEVLTGPSAIDELNKRAIAYKKISGENVPLEGESFIEEKTNVKNS